MYLALISVGLGCGVPGDPAPRCVRHESPGPTLINASNKRGRP